MMLFKLLLIVCHMAVWAVAAVSAVSKNRTVSIDNHKRDNELLMWSVKLHLDSNNNNNHNNYSNNIQWINGTEEQRVLNTIAERVAQEAGLVSWGQIGLLHGVYSLVYWPRELALELGERPSLSELRKRHQQLRHFDWVKQRVERYLTKSTAIRWFSQEIARSRQPRGLLDTCNDPFAAYQWHLKSKYKFEFDVNVTGVWEEGNYGDKVTVCLIDDGIDYTNPDLADAYNPKGSYDFNENDYDPMPSTRSRDFEQSMS